MTARMKIEKDKRKHFYVGIVLGFTIQAFFIWLLPSHFFLDIITSLVVLFAGCYAFELFSRVTGKGHYEFMDAVYGTAGGFLGMGICLLVELWKLLF